MEDLIRPIYQERASHRNTLGILLIEKKLNNSAITDTFDVVLLVIVKDVDSPVFSKHYTTKGQKAALHVVSEEKLNEWLLFGSNRKVIDWVLNGKVLFDRNEYVRQLRNRMLEFPEEARRLKMGVEFAKLIRRYTDGKVFLETNQLLDAYNHVIHALHHLARLAVIEKGFYPEVTVWNQVKQIDAQIYKLYEELVGSDEPLEKRLELLFLASEFLIHSRIPSGSAHLLNVLKRREEAWSIGEMIAHPELEVYSVDLVIMLEYLVDKHVLTTEEMPTKGQNVYHRYYKIANR
ncbi:nucleotidyltransferase-like protein [Anoxybacteroides amylolyticum]|uniref:Nucleotidyltransferase-like family protein n=1 Tax=Anoxybacteroides amylolyticum TaxID=294699 RepID=A0A167T376_9BACL|nr:nucleotidyltransferase-like protein [Anoxybacillus amylolyticus]ANB59384.1 nucleotidyltransferase-like family protein [Anoxybacillus amylolyticus]